MGFALFVDTVGAEEQKMNLNGQFRQTNQKMFAPAPERNNFLSCQQLLIHFCISIRCQDFFPRKRLYQFF
jgi:hypothetical protein